MKRPRARTHPLIGLLGLAVAACSGAEAVDAGVRPGDAGSVAPDSGVDAGPEPCEGWLVEYDLAGSEFEIRNTPFGAGDAVNVVGPGRVQLLFDGDEASGPTEGAVRMLRYELAMRFMVSAVETDVTVTAGPEDCGVATGTRTSSVVAWATPIAGFHSEGTITCKDSEFLCGAAGLPLDQPVVQDETTDQAIMPFQFAGADDFSRFTMDEVEVPNDQVGDTFLRLTGVEITRRCAARATCP